MTPVPLRLVETRAIRNMGGWPILDPPPFARAPGFELLKRELRRYVVGEVRGRSFLVAGHRGAGKTSLVNYAYDEVWRELLATAGRNSETRPARPLLVRLNGRALLEPNGEPEAAETKMREAEPGAGAPTLPASTSAGAAPGGVPPTSSPQMTPPTLARVKPETPPERVLKQIMVALYRALSSELAECYRRHAAALPGEPAEALELAAQLTLELDKAPEAATLRAFWQKLRRLGPGVLWPPQAHGEWAADQGVREIVATATAAQAYQVCTGRVTYTAKGGDSSKLAASLKTEGSAKELVTKLSGLAAGGAAGAAGVWSGWGLAASAGLSIVVGIAAAAGLNWSSERSRQRSRSLDYDFIRDTRPATLDRDLPIVIDRIRAAGLAPLFLVDELDKLDGVAERMKELLDRLKHLIADYGFFCFLTDRDYFEEVERKSYDLSYPPEHTYYSHRILVTLQPRELHDYLGRLIEPAEPLPSDQTEAEASEQRYDELALEYYVMHRARMHSFDLQRKLADFCDADGVIRRPLADLRTARHYQIHLALQLAIEHLLENSDLKLRLDQASELTQIALDALYCVSRKFADDEREFELNEQAFEYYLTRRLNVQHDVLKQSASPDEVTFLLSKARQIADWLLRPNDLLATLRAAIATEASPDTPPRRRDDQLLAALSEALGVPDAPTAPPGVERERRLRFIEVVSDLAAQPPLTLLDAKVRRYRWEVDAYGLPYERAVEVRTRKARQKEPAADPQPKKSDSLWNVSDHTPGGGAPEAVLQLQEFVEYLHELDLDVPLLVEKKLLPTSPAWQAVERALDRLSASGGKQDEQEHSLDLDAVLRFLSAIERNRVRITWALGTSASATIDAGQVLPTDLGQAVNALVRYVNFDSASDVAGAVSLPYLVNNPEVRRLTEVKSKDFESWIRDLRAATSTAQGDNSGKTTSDRSRPLWDVWAKRLVYWLRGNRDLDPPASYDDVVLAAANVLPSAAFRADLSRVAVGEWSRLISASSQQPEPETPQWTGWVALAALGFDPLRVASFEGEDSKLGLTGRQIQKRLRYFRPEAPGVLVVVPHLGDGTPNFLEAAPDPALRLVAIDSLSVRQTSFARELVESGQIRIGLVLVRAGREDTEMGHVPEFVRLKIPFTAFSPDPQPLTASPSVIYGARSLAEVVEQALMRTSA